MTDAVESAAAPAVYEAIAKVSHDLAERGVGKDRKNQQQGFQYRGVDDVYQVLAHLLPKHGLVILPRVVKRDWHERETGSGKAMFAVVCEVEFDLVAVEDGSKHTVRFIGEGMDMGDKATNKAMAIAYKYMAFQVFCIPLEGVIDDPDATTPEQTKPSSESDKQPEKKPAAPPAEKPAAPKQTTPKPGPAKPGVAPMPMPDSVTEELKKNFDAWKKVLTDAPADALKEQFAKAYAWASELPDARARAWCLMNLTVTKDERKKALNIA